MASKQRWSSTLGSRDVFELMDALEQMTGTTIELCLSLRNSHGTRGPWMRAQAITKLSVDAEPVRSGSAWIQCSTTDFVSLDIAAFRVLYQLDSKLDWQEREEKVKKSKASPAE